MFEIGERYYFAYGSNMNLEQMEFRCPDAVVVENVQLDDYRLAFCGRNPGNGVATILPEEGSHVDGVLWNITPRCEKSLDYYEGYPHLYGKETISVRNEKGIRQNVAVYVMNSPYKDCPSTPPLGFLSEGDTGRVQAEQAARFTSYGGSAAYRTRNE